MVGIHLIMQDIFLKLEIISSFGLIMEPRGVTISEISAVCI